MSISKLGLKGRMHVEHFDKDGNLKATYRFPNGIVDEGIDMALDAIFSTGVGSSEPFYLALIDDASFTAVAAADTAVSHAGWIENTDYTEATRPLWLSTETAGSRSITNSLGTVDFSINATITLQGIFVTTVNTKGSSTGTLWSTALFASTVGATSGDTLKITYTVSG